jgi:predicted TIM-barrel fold metal-dependent hydrolase
MESRKADHQSPPRENPIINCHTHIFTGKHVPPFLARSFVWWPLYYLIYLPAILSLVKNWNKFSDNFFYSRTYRRLNKIRYRIRRPSLLRMAARIAGIWISLQVFFILYDWISLLIPPNEATAESVETARRWLQDYHLLFPIDNTWLQWALVFLVLLFIRTGRNLIIFVFKKVWGFFKILPGKMTQELLERYMLLARFTLYKNQKGIFSKLRDQYPSGTCFIVLPMDMKYMGAGPLPEDGSYRHQMEELAGLKRNLEKDEKSRGTFRPFIFVDPRRIEEEGQRFFHFSVRDGKVDLEPCFIKTYIEEIQFNGFKIYPALGYYPFDEKLLPLWKYAADRGIPILTHCIRGTIFYRGRKKRVWDYHPVFEQKNARGSYEPMLLPELANSEFSVNFGHPLNYLCLLDELLLRKLVQKAEDPRVRELFGYRDQHTPLQRDLEHLKICLAHFGGAEEWEKYLEKDRYAYSQQLIKRPEQGINFLYNRHEVHSPGKLEQIWKYVDWYSIICSLMIQYPNVYSDISYTLHDPNIFPLLKQTVQPEHDKLRSRVLYGTDFYVVRNYKSDKQLHTDTAAHLSEEEFDLIARENPRTFLGLDAK